MKIVWKIIKGFFYYTTALLLGIVFTALIWAGVAYFSYENYYIKYLEVQKAWVEVDKAYVKDIQTVSEQISVVKESISKTNWKDAAKKQEFTTKVEGIEYTLKNASSAMEYNEKFTSYSQVLATGDQLRFIAKELNLNETANTLSNISADNKPLVDAYNVKAQEWNKKSKNFPANLISEIAHFHDWMLFK